MNKKFSASEPERVEQQNDLITVMVEDWNSGKYFNYSYTVRDNSVEFFLAL